MSSKAPTTLLLKEDKSFFAFGYEAENIYRENAEKFSSDSDSESDEQRKPKFNCKDLYYFQRFKMLLHENKVSTLFHFKFVLYTVRCNYSSSELSCCKF